MFSFRFCSREGIWLDGSSRNKELGMPGDRMTLIKWLSQSSLETAFSIFKAVSWTLSPEFLLKPEIWDIHDP
jgi:hypothetical protein